VKIGEAACIITGHSIGKLNTQLTLKTFYIDGIFTRDDVEQARAPYNEKV